MEHHALQCSVAGSNGQNIDILSHEALCHKLLIYKSLHKNRSPLRLSVGTEGLLSLLQDRCPSTLFRQILSVQLWRIHLFPEEIFAIADCSHGEEISFSVQSRADLAALYGI